MSESKHTPGPWTLQPGGGHAYNSIVGSDIIHTNGRDYPELRMSSASYTDRVCENLGDMELPGPRANAALICAAPDLLEALESLVANLTEGDFISTTRIDVAVKAIAKATGSQ